MIWGDLLFSEKSRKRLGKTPPGQDQLSSTSHFASIVSRELTKIINLPVLSDSALKAAESFGIAFELAPELVELYGRVGNDLPVLNGNGHWVLPLPATYVIDRAGQIVFAHVEADYRERAEPDDVLASVARAQDAALI